MDNTNTMNLIKLTGRNFTTGSLPKDIMAITGGYVYKYMPIDRALEMLNEKTITLVSPDLWKDPYEKKYLHTNFKTAGFHQPPIYCLCARKDYLNEEASWKIYSEGDYNPAVLFHFKTVELLKCLVEYGKTQGFDVYLSEVDYMSLKEINNIGKNGTTEYSRFFIPKFGLPEYLKLMSVKRISYEYEHELRIFLVPNNDNIEKCKEDLLHVPISCEPTSLIGKITLPPKEYGFKKSLRNSIMEACHNARNSKLKDLTTKEAPINVVSSSLYKTCKPVISI